MLSVKLKEAFEKETPERKCIICDGTTRLSCDSFVCCTCREERGKTMTNNQEPLFIEKHLVNNIADEIILKCQSIKAQNNSGNYYSAEEILQRAQLLIGLLYRLGEEK